ncbi:hypothetical protein OG819_53175 [Streptomyces sp. NBC_01549]|uniref:hypothetical protein n=1 Tax=unclassified Streptomyces TaxID=2593676 RepID=UPI002255E1C6|nr:hypothetical protein [Streptomyces sp. NBC_01549]MCX4597967.1 hypothetical protein [Streptomyces sp. NBC_01549]
MARHRNPYSRRAVASLWNSPWNSLWNVNPYGTFRLDMDAWLDLGPTVAVPRPRTSADAATRSARELR